MKRFSENRFLADLYRKDAVQAVFLQSLVDGLNNLAKGTGVALSGDHPAPPPVNAINVKASGEMVHVTLTHAAEVSRAIEYSVEVDTNPNFTAPHLVGHSISRTHFFVLPGFNDSGVQQPWYIRAYAQYPGSKPSQPLVFGGLANPTPLILKGGAGGTKLTPLGSTGSGTASTTGQQGGSGRGKFRVSTPKVIRVGKQQAAAQPTQTTVQPGGQPVIIFTPQPNGNTPPVVVVDQSGNGGIDFGGGTPIFKRLTANGVAFADLSGNLLLKNIHDAAGVNISPSTSSSTYVVITDMSLTFSTQGNPVLVFFESAVTMSTTGTQLSGNLAVFRDGTQITADYLVTITQTGSQNYVFMVAIGIIDSPSAGSHTYDARFKSGVGAPTVICFGTARRIQAVELG